MHRFIIRSSKIEITAKLIEPWHLTDEETDIQKGYEKFTDRSQMFQLPVKHILQLHESSIFIKMKCQNGPILKILDHCILFD